MKKFNSNWCTFIIFVTQIAAFVPFGINLTILNASEPAIISFVNETFLERHNVSAPEHTLQVIIAMSQSFLLVGTAVGCILVRPMLAGFSRRTNLIFVHCNSILATILMSPIAKLSPSYESIIAGRFVSGVSRGIVFALVPLYITEIVNRKTLGSYQTFNGVFLYMGASLGNALAHPAVLGNTNGWPYLMAVPAVFSVMYLFIIIWLPHSPTYLLLNQSQIDPISDTPTKKNKAYLTLQRLRIDSEKDVIQEYNQLCQELDDDSKIRKATFCEIFSTKKYRMQLIGTMFIQLAAQFAGLQVVLQYTNSVFETAGVDANKATLFSVGLFLVLVISCFLASPLLHRFGSKKLFFIGMLMILISICILMTSTLVNSANLIPLSVVSLVFYFIGSGVGPMVAMFTLPSEITTVRARPMILSISGVVFWLYGTAMAFLGPFLLASIGGYIYLIFIGFILLDLAYVWWFIPNTHKKTVVEIQQMLMRKPNEKRSSNDMLSTSGM